MSVVGVVRTTVRYRVHGHNNGTHPVQRGGYWLQGHEQQAPYLCHLFVMARAAPSRCCMADIPLSLKLPSTCSHRIGIEEDAEFRDNHEAYPSSVLHQAGVTVRQCSYTFIIIIIERGPRRSREVISRSRGIQLSGRCMNDRSA